MRGTEIHFREMDKKTRILCGSSAWTIEGHGGVGGERAGSGDRRHHRVLRRVRRGGDRLQSEHSKSWLKVLAWLALLCICLTWDVMFVRSLPLARTSGFTKSTLVKERFTKFYVWKAPARKKERRLPWGAVHGHGWRTIEWTFPSEILGRHILKNGLWP